MAALGVKVIDSDSMIDIEIDPELLLSEASFQISLKSTMISLYKDSGPFSTFAQKRMSRYIQKTSLKVFMATSMYLNNTPDESRLFVPNGRFADQKAFIIAGNNTKNANSSLYYFEKGILDKTFYCGKISLHDRLSMQKAIGEINSSFRENQSIAWFENRKSNSLINEFTYGWAKNRASAPLIQAKKKVVVFNSSADEFESLDFDWKTSQWECQWEAFEHVIRYLLGIGMEVEIRLHPNGMNKSRREKRRERLHLKILQKQFPEITVFPPNSSIDSYGLMTDSTFIVVWNSTIGLEAMYLSKPVVCLQAAEWDQLIPVLKLANKNEILGFEHRIPTPERGSAVKYFAGRLSLDTALDWNYYATIYNKMEGDSFFYRLARTCNERGNLAVAVVKALFPCRNAKLFKLLRRVRFNFQSWRQTVDL
jgi:hypothetical protein